MQIFVYFKGASHFNLLIPFDYELYRAVIISRPNRTLSTSAGSDFVSVLDLLKETRLQDVLKVAILFYCLKFILPHFNLS